jgi:hypothetical protein
MIPYEIDPSLHTAEPEPPRLDDGFSPPEPHESDAHSPVVTHPASPVLLPDKSEF